MDHAPHDQMSLLPGFLIGDSNRVVYMLALFQGTRFTLSVVVTQSMVAQCRMWTVLILTQEAGHKPSHYQKVNIVPCSLSVAGALHYLATF